MTEAKEPSLVTVSEGVENKGLIPDVTKDGQQSKNNWSSFGAKMAEEALLTLSDNKDGSDARIHHNASSFTHSEKLSRPGLELRFENLDFNIKGKQILTDISGRAVPGKILAVMGPSGSGKTTLLNILGGRVDCPRCRATIGGQQLTKENRRKLSYVLQQDIFFPNLTLQQTLQFAAELRLPESFSSDLKKQTVSHLIDQLDMKKCTNTIIGDNMVRGLSGGEKKRANIANELLTDPAVLLLDEPTSGLDSSTAYALTLSLKKYAVQSGKTVMMTIHQPSVQMFFQFDTVLLLSGGRIAYYGSPEDVLRDFQEMGFSCDFTHYNPADFILDVVKSGSEAAERLIAASDERRLKSKDCPIRTKKNGIQQDVFVMTSDTNSTPSNVTNNGINMKDRDGDLSRDLELANQDKKKVTPTNESDKPPRWPTSYLHQTKILTVRSFIQGKYRYLSKLKFIKTIGVALIMGLMWFQIGQGDVTEMEVNDIVGALFFVLVFNSFNSLFDVLMIFPSEREVINKERMSGSYRLSAYYLSKSISELPLCLVIPSIATVIFYWLAGLNGFHNAWSFFGTWLVMITITLSSQSMGLFISAATMDFDHALVLAIFMMISFMLLGGFYVKNFPVWLYWMRYLSPFMYSWSLLLYLEFDSDSRVLCNVENSAFPSCGNTTATNETMFVPYNEILDFYGADVPAWLCCVALLIMVIIFRVLGYIFLRVLHKPNLK